MIRKRRNCENRVSYSVFYFVVICKLYCIKENRESRLDDGVKSPSFCNVMVICAINPWVAEIEIGMLNS